MNGVRFTRKTALKVKGGKVRRKDNLQPTGRRGFVLDRATPKKGFRHVVTKREIFDFIELIPDWQELLNGIESIYLSPGGDDCDGSYTTFHRESTGAIELEAWPTDLVQDLPIDYFDEHAQIFEKLELRFERQKQQVRCWFDEKKAKAFMLLHIFLHELGHHHDRICSKQQRLTNGGEDYAENFALHYEKLIWPGYVAKFGRP